MKILKGRYFLSGFFFEEPLAALPAITHCGEALCDPEHRLAAHRHPGFEFLYLSRGATRWRVGGRVHAHGMGDLFVARPGEWHGTAGASGVETHQLWIGLELEKFGAEGRRLAALLLKRNVRLLRDCRGAEPLLRAIVRQLVTPLPGHRAVIVAHLRALFAVVEQQSLLMAHPVSSRSAARLPYSHGVQRALAYMERRLDRRLPLAELAAVATVRRTSHFCARFRREVGTAPAAHHLRLRLAAAREALLQPAFDVTGAAHRFGFASSQHFSAAFRRAFGVTPRTWRAASAKKMEMGLKAY